MYELDGSARILSATLILYPDSSPSSSQTRSGHSVHSSEEGSCGFGAKVQRRFGIHVVKGEADECMESKSFVSNDYQPPAPGHNDFTHLSTVWHSPLVLNYYSTVLSPDPESIYYVHYSHEDAFCDGQDVRSQVD